MDGIFSECKNICNICIRGSFFTSPGLRLAFEHYKILYHSLKQLNPWTLFNGTILNLGVTWQDINIIILGLICLILADYLRENTNMLETGFVNKVLDSDGLYGYFCFLWFLFMECMVQDMMQVPLYIKDFNGGSYEQCKYSKYKKIIGFVSFIIIIAVLFSKVTWLFRGNDVEAREDILGYGNENAVLM